ncbi:superinfection immunity protein [Vampirovibrio chlorellavorus]|uniref:superinfection immunity protein n=1 Tax=Vampirovibrio chlorellavorus TaxID=758823 RepID=UPI0026ECEFB1|nr:superinfection immunity protein [Vampirovibrio chlorellavorus]
MEVMILLGLPLIFLYFLPTWVALRFRHRQLPGIFTVNLLAGWSLAGWLMALAWAIFPWGHRKYQLSPA